METVLHTRVVCNLTIVHSTKTDFIGGVEFLAIFSLERDEILIHVTVRMNLENITLDKRSQTKKINII